MVTTRRCMSAKHHVDSTNYSASDKERHDGAPFLWQIALPRPGGKIPVPASASCVSLPLADDVLEVPVAFGGSGSVSPSMSASTTSYLPEGFEVRRANTCRKNDKIKGL